MAYFLFNIEYHKLLYHSLCVILFSPLFTVHKSRYDMGTISIYNVMALSL